ncbi:hypothetical protein HID58_062663, partial [Brassica napus]
MVSGDEKESFVLEKDQCWVVAENKEIKAKEAYDSRYIWSSFNSKHCWKSYVLSENSCGSWSCSKQLQKKAESLSCLLVKHDTAMGRDSPILAIDWTWKRWLKTTRHNKETLFYILVSQLN